MRISCVGTSRPVNGSSSNSRLGRSASARATSTRCRCPPDSSPIGRRAGRSGPPAPVLRRRLLGRPALARRSQPMRCVAAGHRCRPDVDRVVPDKLVPLRHVPNPSREPPAGTRRRRRCSPASNGSRPSKARNKVVFPAPLGPINPTCSPAPTSKSTSRNTTPPTQFDADSLDPQHRSRAAPPSCAAGGRGRAGSEQRDQGGEPPTHRHGVGHARCCPLRRPAAPRPRRRLLVKAARGWPGRRTGGGVCGR